MRGFLAEFNVYRWAGRMLVDAARLRKKQTVIGRAGEELSRLAGLSQ
jgi:trehalose 6-phosphate synthase